MTNTVLKQKEKQIADLKVGDGCAVAGYSDVHACHVVAISANGKSITVQEDTAILLNKPNSGHPEALHVDVGGFCAHVSGKQIWDLTPNPHASTKTFTLRKNGKWRRQGDSMTGTGDALLAAHFHHYDFNF